MLGRVIADEAELLTMAVHPDARRQRIGQFLLNSYEAEAQKRGAKVSFLEVADNNAAAITLYTRQNYVQTGRRPLYYKSPTGERIDALIMSRQLG